MLHKLVYTWAFIVLHSTAMMQTAQVRPTLEIYNYTCFKYTERLKFIECEFQKIAINRYGVSIRLMLDQDVGKNIRVRIWCDIMPKNSKRAIHILDIKLNACSILQQLTSNQLLSSILTEFKRSTTFPTTCPFKGNILYRQDNFSLTGDILPTYWPMFNFTFAVELFERNKMFGGWQAIGAKVN